jgi:hypothetical protein
MQPDSFASYTIAEARFRFSAGLALKRVTGA